MVELSNGCICCTINEGLVEAVTRILSREERVDRLIIETTGVADPLPIILTFVGSDFRDFTRLDSVITLIDAENFTPEHFNSEVAYKQIAYGDILLLNKIDLASREQLTALEIYIASIKKNPRIIHTEHAQVPLPPAPTREGTQRGTHTQERRASTSSKPSHHTRHRSRNRNGRNRNRRDEHRQNPREPTNKTIIARQPHKNKHQNPDTARNTANPTPRTRSGGGRENQEQTTKPKPPPLGRASKQPRNRSTPPANPKSRQPFLSSLSFSLSSPLLATQHPYLLKSTAPYGTK
jgi:G3E family GTPase